MFCSEDTMKYLIVAQYKENIEWVEQIPHGWIPRVFQKGIEGLPNIGREPSTFFHVLEFIAATLEDDDLVAFVQGWPFDHSPQLFKHLEELEYSPDWNFKWLSEHQHVSDGDGRPAHGGLPVAKRYEEWLGRPWPGSVTFYAGGQFVITGKAAKRWSGYKYNAMKEAMSEGQNPWVMERLWEEFFREKQSNPE